MSVTRLWILLAILLSILSPIRVRAEERVALVIGMARYENIVTLRNTAQDAALIAETLDRIGFHVTTLIDARHADLVKALEEFRFSAETADLALIYFAGHGVEVQGENFLIPVDAKVSTNAELQQQSVSLKDMLDAVDHARKMRVVILDSCRNNPLPGSILAEAQAVGGTAADTSRGAGGLVTPSPDRGTLVAYAARDGSVALDGTGANSPFARALADRLAVPGLEISLMFRQVRDDVLANTGGMQEPHTYGSLSGIPYFLAGPDRVDSQIENNDMRVAWSDIRPEQEKQLEMLAASGDTRSMIGLAYMRMNENGTKFDPSGAYSLLERAAAAGSAEAQFELAKMLEKGVGVPADPARALQLYQLSAAQDFPDAINDVGFFYYHGALGLPKDADRALAFFERAADLRYPAAMYNFAALIDDGLVEGKGAEDSAAYLFDALRAGSEDVLAILSERPDSFSVATRKALQRKLREVDFYGGTIDGAFGAATIRGLKTAYGLKE